MEQRRHGHALDLEVVQAEGAGDGPGHLDDRRRVLARVAVALEERRREGLDDRRVGRVGVLDPLLERRRGAGAAQRPRAVEAVAGGHEELVDRAAGQVHGDAGGDGDEAGAGLLAALQLGQQALAAGLGAVLVGPRHEDGQLVGAGSPEDVAGARQAAQADGDRGQGGVAGLDAAARVQGPEAVDVDEGERGGLAVALGAGELAGGGAAEGLVDEEPGLRVAVAAVVQLGLEDPHAGLRLGQPAAQLVLVPGAEHTPSSAAFRPEQRASLRRTVHRAGGGPPAGVRVPAQNAGGG